MLFYEGSGGIAAPYTLVFTPTPLFNDQIQAYIDYVHLVNPAITTFNIAFRLNHAGTGQLPSGGPQVGNQYFVWWIAEESTVYGHTNFFTLATEPMQVNTWYRVNTGIYLNDGLTYFPFSCAENRIDVRLQVLSLTAKSLGESPILQIRGADGVIVEKRMPVAMN